MRRPTLESLNFLHRLGRHLAWSSPTLYRPVGICRERGDCKDTNYDLWIEGFPRSANTFAVKSFQAANPSAKIRSHHHIPAFVIQSLRDRKPGMLLVRKPEDAVLSWAIFWHERIGGCLDYYIDFHRALLPRRDDLFVVGFEEVTAGFDAVMTRFNRTFETSFAVMVHDEQSLAHCFALMDRDQVAWRGFVDEMRVPRPSASRAECKQQIRQTLRDSPALLRKLQTANSLYNAFRPAGAMAESPTANIATQQLPTC